MQTDKVDFSNYSKEELIESLESVDDKKYSENAKQIYSLLELKLASERVSIDDRYNEEDGLLENALEVLLFPIFSGRNIKQSEMQEKLLRIRNMVAASET